MTEYGDIKNYTVKKVDEVVRHQHLVTQDQFSLVSGKDTFLLIQEYTEVYKRCGAISLLLDVS